MGWEMFEGLKPFECLKRPAGVFDGLVPSLFKAGFPAAPRTATGLEHSYS
jgi:hypothetical protein